MVNLPNAAVFEPLLKSGCYDFDAEVIPDHDDPGIDDLPMVIREQFQLPLDQRFHDLADTGKIRWGSRGIESQISFHVSLKLLPSNFGRCAGHIPGGTGGVQTIMPVLNCLASSNEACRDFRDHLGHLALG
jgi:hypothetical protein